MSCIVNKCIELQNKIQVYKKTSIKYFFMKIEYNNKLQ